MLTTYPIEQDLEIVQGATFNPFLQWGVEPWVFKAITAVTKAAPPVLTVTGHGMPDSWPALITNVGGMTQINAQHDPAWDTDIVYPTVVTANSLSLPIDATGYDTYTSGGVLAYLTPQDLASYTARMQVRATRDSTTVLLSLTTENTRIVLNNTLKRIEFLVLPAITAALSFVSAVYDLEMVHSGGTVVPLMAGKIRLRKEVTRD